MSDEKKKQIVEYVDRFGHKYGVVFAERYFSELGNRLCELNFDLEYIAMIDIAEGKVHFRTVRDYLDVGGEIAHAYGGGGHPKAARSEFNVDIVRDTLTGLIFGEVCMSSIIKSICKREGIEYF